MSRTTDANYVNRNGQINLGRTDPPREGNDHAQKIYVLHCPACVANYGVNGSDIFQRKCPSHQGGRPGLPLTSDEITWRPG